MAQGDTRYKRTRGTGGGSRINWDAQDREHSRKIMQAVLDSAMGNVEGYMLNLSGSALSGIKQATTVIKTRGRYDWERLMDKLTPEGKEQVQAKVTEYDKDKQAERNQRMKDAQEKRIQAMTEEALSYRKAAGLTAGALQSDFHQALTWKEVYGQPEGEWLDDPVAAYTTGLGFGEEVTAATDVKLQITLSLDVSNSMWNNRIAAAAVQAFIEIGMALQELQAQYPTNVYIQTFVFCLYSEGKRAMRLDKLWGYAGTNAKEDYTLGVFDKVREWAKFQPHLAGQDTYINPLFQAIEQWEVDESDPGCVRLDLVITDAVLEHPKDIRLATQTQERRDGELQTLFLNFLPEADWAYSTLPARCIQYPAQADNIQGLMRNLIAEFVGVHVM